MAFEFGAVKVGNHQTLLAEQIVQQGPRKIGKCCACFPAGRNAGIQSLSALLVAQPFAQLGQGLVKRVRRKAPNGGRARPGDSIPVFSQKCGRD